MGESRTVRVWALAVVVAVTGLGCEPSGGGTDLLPPLDLGVEVDLSDFEAERVQDLIDRGIELFDETSFLSTVDQRWPGDGADWPPVSQMGTFRGDATGVAEGWRLWADSADHDLVAWYLRYADLFDRLALIFRHLNGDFDDQFPGKVELVLEWYEVRRSVATIDAAMSNILN